MYVRSRRFDVSVRPTCSAVGCTPYIFEGIVLLYLGGHEKILLSDDFRGKLDRGVQLGGIAEQNYY